jgi:F0F1-type ATP synthase membrane subunit b/b'
MEPLIALGGILLNAIPTFLLVWILFLFTSRVFLKPLQATLRKRHESTEGLRQAAEARVALAERKTAEYQEALRASSAELYRQQEQQRQTALQRRTQILQEARRRAEERIARGRQEIRQDAETAKKHLAQESEQLAQRVLQAILEPASATRPFNPSGATGAPR